MNKIQCSVCKEWLDKEYFHWRKDRARQHSSACKQCVSNKKDNYIPPSCLITAKAFKKKAEQQDYRCAICRLPESRAKLKTRRRLSVDHDHETLVIRELLCSKCNVGLGNFQDDPQLLRQAAEYLERHNSLNQRNRAKTVIITYDDGTSETFENVKALYSKSTNWKKDSTGKIAEEWIEHNLVWTAEPAIYEHVKIPESPKELVQEISTGIKAESYINDPNFAGIEYGQPRYNKNEKVIATKLPEFDLSDLTEGYGNGHVRSE